MYWPDFHKLSLTKHSVECFNTQPSLLNAWSSFSNPQPRVSKASSSAWKTQSSDLKARPCVCARTRSMLSQLATILLVFTIVEQNLIIQYLFSFQTNLGKFLKNLLNYVVYVLKCFTWFMPCALSCLMFLVPYVPSCFTCNLR